MLTCKTSVNKMQKSNPLVTVVVPAYNTASYIGRMLDCIKNQTYKNIEVIVINDGSTDETLCVAKKYADIDNRFSIIDIPNHGVSFARNLGIEKSHGKKVFFGDSDDVVNVDTIEKCLEYAEKNNVSSVLYGYCNRYNGQDQAPHMSILSGQIFRNEEIVKKIIPHFIGHSFSDVNLWIKGKQPLRYGKESTALWHIMCDLDIIKSNNISFDTGLSLGEDTTFINTYFLYEDSIGYLDECFYHLEQRANGANLSSITNANKRLIDKTKLVFSRLKIDELAKNVCNRNIHGYWEGTLIFSALEMALRMSHNPVCSRNVNKVDYLDFMKIDAVKLSVRQFSPSFGLKALPFMILKILGPSILFDLCSIIPKKFVKVIV